MTANDSRTAKFLAEGRGQTFNYLPANLTLVRDEASPLYDERVHEAPTREMIDSIKRMGVFTPILVTPIIDDHGKQRMGVVYGRQRVRGQIEAARELRAERKPFPGSPRSPQSRGEIPAIVVTDITDEEIRELITAENENRRGDSLANRIAKANRLYNEYKATADAEGEPFRDADAVARVARVCGVSVATVKRWREVPRLSAAARKGIFSGDIPIGSVDELRAMSPANQAEAVQRIKAAGAGGKASARKATENIPKAETPKQSRRPRKAIEEKIAEFEAKAKAGDKATLEQAGLVIDALKFCLGEDTL